MIRRFIMAGVAGTIAIAGCSGGPDMTPRVEFALSTQPAVLAVAGLQSAAPFASEVYTDAGGDTLALDSVFVVVRRLELKRTVALACDSLSTSADGCEEMKLGPFLIELPLGTPGAARQFTVALDTGTYSKVEFEIRKAEAGDATFLSQHPGYEGVSVRAVGTFNGTPFTYTTGLDVEQEIEFVPPLAVADGATTFTLFVDLATWFKNGTSLVDPATAGASGVNESLVHENIQNSFKAFEDENHDGHDDNAP